MVRLLVSGALIQAAMVGILCLGDASQGMPTFFVLFGAAFLAYVFAAAGCRGMPIRAVVVLGLLFRLTLLPSTPSLSDDVYRYVWDGRTQTHGINPYRYAPASAELAHLRDEAVYERVNHGDVPTIYPPLAQLFFLGCYAIWPSLWCLKTALVALDLLGAWFLLGLIRLRGLPSGLLLIYLWNPLVIVEVSGSGHIDILGVALLLWALLLAERGCTVRAGAALGLSFLSKLFPACLVPFLVCARADTPLGRPPTASGLRRVGPALAFLAVSVLGYAPYLGVGVGVWTGLRTYAARWSFNGSVYDILCLVLGSDMLARAGLGLTFGTVVVILAWRGARPVPAGSFLTALFILLSPTVHPWYLLWLVPYLALRPNPAWMGFTGLVMLSYHVLIGYAATGVWEEALWVRLAEYGGLAAIWLIGRQRMRRPFQHDRDKGPGEQQSAPGGCCPGGALSNR
jgi:hypothetical protein